MYRPATNVTDSPVLIDDRGRQLGGREWGPVDTTADEVKAAVDLGALVIVDPANITKDTLAEARQARDDAAELQARHEALTALDADTTRELAETAGIPLTADMVDDDGRPAEPRRRHVAELVADLVRSPDVATSDLQASTSTSSTSDASPTPAKATSTTKKAAAPSIPPTTGGTPS